MIFFRNLKSRMAIRLNPILTALSAVTLILLWTPPLSHGQGGGGNRGGGGQGGGQAGQTARQYYNNTMLGEALIEVDPETRSVIIITDEETNTQIGEVIQHLDRPKPQVLIKVAFVEITHNNDLDVGVEASWQRNIGTTTNLFSTAFGLAGQTQGGLYQMFYDDLQVSFRALAEDGRLEILSRPSILARNNQQATITVGKEVPFIRNSRFDQFGNQINTVEYEDIGIILTVTPFITDNGLVEMIVAPEISTTTDETVQISAGIEAPVFAKRAAETVVVTPNGKTVVIGGLMEKNKVTSERKVPILGDIPVLGLAFRRKIKQDEKTELLIFLTPYIINQPEELLEITERERSKATLQQQAYSREEMDEFLDIEQSPETIQNGEGRSQGISQQRKQLNTRSGSRSFNHGARQSPSIDSSYDIQPDAYQAPAPQPVPQRDDVGVFYDNDQ
jgi:general secretion pathway protein D